MSELGDLFKKSEKELVKTLLKWQLSREGKNVEEKKLDHAAGSLVDETHGIIKRHGGNILNEIKEALWELKKTRKTD